MPTGYSEYKICTKCKVKKAACAFNKHNCNGEGATRPECRMCQARAGKDWYARSRKRKLAKDKAFRRARRERVLNHYGHACACCGEHRSEFLAIDHINGDGAKHRKAIAAIGYEFYRWLEVKNFPDGFRLLCHNCNSSLGFYGQCPHEYESIT